MGFFDSGDSTGQYLGNLIDPTTADQFIKARQQDGLLGLSIGLLNGSGPSRLPVPFTSALGAGLQGLQSAQNGLTPQALQAAQTANQIADARLKQVQGASAAYQFANLPAYQKALLARLQGGAEGTGSAPPMGQTPTRLDSSFPAVSSTTADAMLPTEARALLDTISGPESNGAYNVRYTPNGGTTFDSYASHPGIYEDGPAGKSSAAGRYQMVKSTWEPIAKTLGLSNFNPINQDQAAWGLAQKTYSSNTGRDLLADLQNGDTSRVADALGSQWATLRHSIGSYGANLQKYNLNLNAPGQAQAQAGNSPQGAPQGAPQAPAGLLSGFSPTDLPYGLTPQRILGDQRIAALAGFAGQTPPDFIKGSADLPNQIGKAVGEQNARQGAEAAAAFPKAYGTAAGTQAANPDLVDVTIGPPGEQREIKLPKADYLRMFASGGQQNPNAGLLPMTGQPMPSPGGGPMPPPAGPVPGPMPQGAPTGLLAPGGALGVPQAPQMPSQAPQGLLAPGGPQMQPVNFGPTPQQNLMNMIGGRPTLAPPGLRPSSPGGVPIGTPGAGPTISPAQAQAMNASNPNAGSSLPVMPSSYIFGRGMAPPPGAGSVSPQMPVQGPQGIPAPPQGPMASPAPTPSLAPSMGNIPANIGKPVLPPTAAMNPYALTFKPPVGKGPGQDSDIVIPPGAQNPVPVTVPALAKAPTYTGSSASLESDQKENWPKMAQGWATAQQALPEAIQRITAIGNVMRKYQTGAWSEHISDVLADLKAAGIQIDPDNLRDPAKMQEILKNNFAASLATMKATGLQRWTQSELFATQKNFANPTLQPAANFEILTQGLGRLLQQKAEFQAWQVARGNGWPGDLAAFDQQWTQANSLNNYIDSAKVMIGPLAGMNQKEIAATMPRTAGGGKFIQSGGKWLPFAMGQ